MTVTLPMAALNLSCAMTLGAIIGLERQVRQRMAGLRTNALVATGAAGFVTFAALAPVDTSPTRVAAQVVAGIGFLGAGIIFRDGFNVHGLNTAATLWCSAALGVLAGGGQLPFALLMAMMVVFINLGLRPIVRWLKRHTLAGLPILRQFRVLVRCAVADEAAARGLILRNLSVQGLHVVELLAESAGEAVELTAFVHGESTTDTTVELAVGRLQLESSLQRVRWAVADDV